MITVIEIPIEEFKKDIYNRYTKLFPKDEQREWKKIEKTYSNGIEHFYKIVIDNINIGFIILEKINNNPYYIDYFAIYEEYQNKGYGTSAIKYLIDNIIMDKGLIAEIEKVKEDDLQTINRLNFYKNIGFKEVGSEYLLYNVCYEPIAYLNNIDKTLVDKSFFEYYITNVGKEDLEKNCKIIK